MKAMILAAGYGMRLRPITETIPKALFPVSGRPILDRTIQYLKQAGCREIIINIHHLSEKIEAFLSRQSYGIAIHTRYETELLGTGGAIKNVADFWDDQPFIIINSDILTDMDLKRLYEFHIHHPHPVTLALYDDKDFNTVSVSREGYVTGFDMPGKRPIPITDDQTKMTFTGIQVLSPEVLELIPDHQYSDIKDAYEQIFLSGRKIQAYAPRDIYWKDIGAPERYRQIVYDQMVINAFAGAFPGFSGGDIKSEMLTGDGSDRTWYRLTAENKTLILADHGIRPDDSPQEVDAFVRIGTHLGDNDISVPVIYEKDTFSGLIFMEDLGDTHLQTIIVDSKNYNEIASHYQAVIQLLVHMSQSAKADFNPSWAYQTPRYDKELILERECRYFIDAFMNGYLKLKHCFDDYAGEFATIADRALEGAIEGFMHRDFQSRNILVKDDHHYVIDFQGGRLGPLQYDLASLLIDPYVALPYDLQDHLVDFCIQQLSSKIPVDALHFEQSYSYCKITRNLQILGAFGFLSRAKGKTVFEQYIPRAIKTLKHHFSTLDRSDFPKLKSLIEKL